MSQDALAALRQRLAPLDGSLLPEAAPVFATGLAEIDEPLGGGLARGGLHEVFAESAADGPAAGGFALALARLAGETGRLVWVRQHMVDVEFGRPHGPGLATLGIDPGRIVLVRTEDAAATLRAAQDAARAGVPGAVVAEVWGAPKILDLTASRRLSLIAGDTGVTILMVRIAASPAPSAAATRWGVRSAPSRPFDAGAPGLAAFSITLLRHRAGLGTRNWLVEWDRDQCRFSNGSPLPRRLDAVPAGRKAPPLRPAAGIETVVRLRRAG